MNERETQQVPPVEDEEKRRPSAWGETGYAPEADEAEQDETEKPGRGRLFLAAAVAGLIGLVFGVAVGGDSGLDRQLAAEREAREAADARSAELEQAVAEAEEELAAGAAELEEALRDAEQAVAEAQERAEGAEAAALEAAESQIAELRAEAEAEAEEIRAEAELALEQAQAEAEETIAQLDQRATQLDERESEIVGQEEAAARSSFGSGVHQVGSDIEPGSYQAPDASRGCYWARLQSDGQSIIQNHFSGEAGPVRVVIQSSDGFFETQGCGTWNKTG